MVDDPRLLNDWLPRIEHREIRYASNIEARRQFRMTLGVDLENHRLPGHICGRACHLGSRHSARSAPGGPEVNQHGYAGLAQNFVEELSIGFQGLIHRRQRRLAGSAMSGVCQVSSWNAVLA